MPWRSTFDVFPDDIGTQDLLDSYRVASALLEQFTSFSLVEHLYRLERMGEEKTACGILIEHCNRGTHLAILVYTVEHGMLTSTSCAGCQIATDTKQSRSGRAIETK